MNRTAAPCSTATAPASSTATVPFPRLGRRVTQPRSCSVSSAGRLGQRRPVPGEVPPAHEHRPALRPRLRAVVRGEGVGLVGEDHQVGVDAGRVVLWPASGTGRRESANTLRTPSRARTSPANVSRPSTIHGRRQIGTTAVTGGSAAGRPRPRAAARSHAGAGPAEHRAQPVERVERLLDGGAARSPTPGCRPRAAPRRPRPGSPRRWRSRGRARRARTRVQSGHLVPPTRATSRPAGCVHQSVAPTSSAGVRRRDRLGQRRDEPDDPRRRRPAERRPEVVLRVLRRR